MNKLLDEYLCKKYPKIFRDRHAPMTQTCLCWGFEHGDGWFFLIDALCSNIQNRIDNPPYILAKTFQNWIGNLWNKTMWNHILYPVFTKLFSYKIYLKLDKCFRYNFKFVPAPIPQVVATQVKEKFGGLRFYYNGGDDIIQGMVQLTESLSYLVCEECGVMNEMVNPNYDGWIQTTCSECVHDSRKESHEKNRRSELIEIWQKIKEEKKRDEQ